MAASIVTPEDLQTLKTELIEEIKKLLGHRTQSFTRKWMKSHEVRKMLLISPGTLQHLRVKGILPFTKIGGVIYYEIEDIEKMMRDNKNNRDFPSRKHNSWRNV